MLVANDLSAHHINNVFGDVFRVVTNSLEVVVDFQDRDDQPKIRGDGLVQRQQFEAFLFQFDFALIDDDVVANDFLGEFPIGLLDGINRQLDLIFDLITEFNDVAVELIDGTNKMSGHDEFPIPG